MNTLHFRHIAAAAWMAAAGLAQASQVVVPVGTGVYNGMTFQGSGTLSFSAELLGALDTGKVAVTPYGDANPVIQKDLDGFYTKVSVSAPFTSLTIDTATNAVVSVATTGGATQTAPVLKSVSSGGSLTVTDLNVDLLNKRVYATLIGGNGVGTLTNFYLWDIRGKAQYDADENFVGYDASTAIVGPTTVSNYGTYETTLSGLAITSDGLNKFSQALGLLSLGKSALQGVHDFGTIRSTLTNGLDDGPHLPPIIPEFPEPSSYALMGVGLVGMLLVKRRRQGGAASKATAR